MHLCVAVTLQMFDMKLLDPLPDSVSCHHPHTLTPSHTHTLTEPAASNRSPTAETKLSCFLPPKKINKNNFLQDCKR